MEMQPSYTGYWPSGPHKPLANPPRSSIHNEGTQGHNQWLPLKCLSQQMFSGGAQVWCPNSSQWNLVEPCGSPNPWLTVVDQGDNELSTFHYSPSVQTIDFVGHSIAWNILPSLPVATTRTLAIKLSSPANSRHFRLVFSKSWCKSIVCQRDWSLLKSSCT